MIQQRSLQRDKKAEIQRFHDHFIEKNMVLSGVYYKGTRTPEIQTKNVKKFMD